MAKKLNRRMAAIPFTKEWFVERKLAKLSKEAKKLSDKAYDLRNRVESAKDEAYRSFSAAEYDRATEKIDEAMSDICEAAEEAREITTPAATDKDRETEKEIRRKCREALGIKRTGGIKKDKADAWRACVKKGGPNGFKVTPSP